MLMTMRVAAVIRTSTYSSALPMSMLVYFLRIMARMSVPPVELSRLNRMAAPREGRITAKNSSSIFWFVRGWVMGYSHSSPASMAENSSVQKMVRMPKPRFRNTKPKTREAMLMTEVNVEELTVGNREDKITAIPVTPPVE